MKDFCDVFSVTFLLEMFFEQSFHFGGNSYPDGHVKRYIYISNVGYTFG